MNKVKFISVLAIGLFISNLILIGFFYFNKPPKGPLDRKMIVIDKLHFDKVQIEQYDHLIELHRKEVRQSNEQIRLLKVQLYSTLMHDQASELKDSMIREVSRVQTHMEEVHYDHFLQIKKLCKSDQLVYFKDLTKELATFLNPPHPPKERPFK